MNRSRSPLGRALGGLLILGTLLGPAAVSAAPRVWLSGVDPVVRAHLPGAKPSDYEALFTDVAAWSRAVHEVAIFKTSTQWLAQGSDASLRRMIATLNQQGIALGVEALMMPRRHVCGAVEGYSAPGEIAVVARRLKQLGGSLKYAAMDEPLWFGHFDTSAKACQAPVSQVVAGLAENVKALRAVFPNVQIGDIEPFQGLAGHGVQLADELAFAQAFRQATGTPLAFVHADLHWKEYDQTRMAALKAAFDGAGIRFGVIYDGNPEDQTDVAWTQNAQTRFSMVEQDPLTEPDDAILQTWMVRPIHMLPETQPGTMTNLVLSYAREITHLASSRSAQGIVGSLSTEAGVPVGGAAISVFATDNGSALPASVRQLAGTVPAGAVKAVIALRINIESEGLGAGAFVVGVSTYRRPNGSSIETPLMEGAAAARGQTITRSQTLEKTGPAFGVSAGQTYGLTVPMGASAGLNNAGYVALIFLTADDQEVKRLKLPFTTTKAPLGSVRTDANGRFQMATADAALASTTMEVDFSGDAIRRGASATVH